MATLIPSMGTCQSRMTGSRPKLSFFRNTRRLRHTHGTINFSKRIQSGNTHALNPPQPRSLSSVGTLSCRDSQLHKGRNCDGRSESNINSIAIQDGSRSCKRVCRFTRDGQELLANRTNRDRMEASRRFCRYFGTYVWRAAHCLRGQAVGLATRFSSSLSELFICESRICFVAAFSDSPSATGPRGIRISWNRTLFASQRKNPSPRESIRARCFAYLGPAASTRTFRWVSA